MKAKTIRMKTLKMLISSKELSSQEEVLKALAKEGFTITQATLSRDLKQLKVAKAAPLSRGIQAKIPLPQAIWNELKRLL